MPGIATIQSRAITKVIDVASKAGVSPGELLASVQLDQELLSDVDSRIPYEKYVALYEQAARLTGDDAFGLHLGESISLQMYDVIGYAAMNSATIGEALKTWIRFYRIWSDGSETTVRFDGNVARIVYEVFDIVPRKCRQECETSLAMIICLGRALVGSEWSPTEVRFQHSAPADISEHTRIFNAPVNFRRLTNEIIVERSFLDRPILKADTNLGVVLNRHAAELLEKLPQENGIVESVRRAMTESLRGGDASLSAVSKRLGMSARTLQRKLSDLGTSHQLLLDDVRRDLSRKYLQESGMAICEVAFLLGFSDTSVFHRAFRRWTGETPGEYQKRVRGSS